MDDARRSSTSKAAGTADRPVITRLIDAPRPLVFSAWTTPEHIARWCFLAALKTEKMTMDFLPGGEWNIDLAMPDGSEIRVRRVFREIVTPERIVFYEKCTAGGNVMLDGTHTILFSEEGGKTRIDISCDLATPFDSENQQGWSEGWSELLDRLTAHVRP
ncbi:MAG: SRPBCC domain-containing protein [Betaproteobacteria bacterium]